jgi:hypothetical protein
MMPSRGKMNVLNAASTRTGLAIQSTNSASRGKRPPNNANKRDRPVDHRVDAEQDGQHGEDETRPEENHKPEQQGDEAA